MRVLLSNDSEPSITVGQAGKGRWSLSLLVSVAIHGAALVVLCWQVAPLFVSPRILARGQGGPATPQSVALYFSQAQSLQARPQPSIVSLPTKRKPTEKPRWRKRSNILERDEQKDSAEAGSPLGSAIDGASEGDEIKPGFAIVFTDPRVARWEIPKGLQGEVVVELTIDEEGKVIAEKLLQGLGHGVDEKVIATLRDWRFRPATRNGIAIPFKYDAHFHFPS